MWGNRECDDGNEMKHFPLNRCEIIICFTFNAIKVFFDVQIHNWIETRPQNLFLFIDISVSGCVCVCVYCFKWFHWPFFFWLSVQGAHIQTPSRTTNPININSTDISNRINVRKKASDHAVHMYIHTHAHVSQTTYNVTLHMNRCHWLLCACVRVGVSFHYFFFLSIQMKSSTPAPKLTLYVPIVSIES